MLAGICHPEFFDHTELEVLPQNNSDNRHTLYTSSILPSSYITASSPSNIWRIYTTMARQLTRRELLSIERSSSISGTLPNEGNGLMSLWHLSSISKVGSQRLGFLIRTIHGIYFTRYKSRKWSLADQIAKRGRARSKGSNCSFRRRPSRTRSFSGQSGRGSKYQRKTQWQETGTVPKRQSSR